MRMRGTNLIDVCCTSVELLCKLLMLSLLSSARKQPVKNRRLVVFTFAYLIGFHGGSASFHLGAKIHLYIVASAILVSVI